jgi:hypothetical protein
MAIIITIKNRKNQLRENLYKEQLNFIGELTTEFYHLHADLTKKKNDIEISNVEISAKIENVFGVMFSNTHIASDKILIKATSTLNCVNEFLKNIEEKNTEMMRENFEAYFKNYRELTNIMRNEMGVHSLSKENEKLLK